MDVPCMIATSTITSKNQTTLPKAVVEALGVKPADKLVYEIEENRVTLWARKGRLVDLARMAPPGPKRARALTKREMRETIGDYLAEADARMRRQWHEERRKEARRGRK